MVKVSFLGQREDRNNVEKLSKYTQALNLNNQRNISKSIDNLSKDSSDKNIDFLMNVAQSIRYGLNCGIKDVKPNNDWMEQLKNATQKSLANNNSEAKKALEARFNEVFLNSKEISPEEKKLLSLREQLLNTTGLQNEIKTSENDNVRNIAKNLDYFVVSSEVSLEEKTQCLEKFNKLMSPEYKINEQLKDKKPQVLGELLNDIVVRTAEQKTPTIKQVDQRHHGMCAAISIARKAMAYEYKPQYVDVVMQELNDSPTMEVYDISKLGTGAKISVPKTYIDFAYAEDKGYRLLDASTLQWMNIAGTTGNGQIESTHFSAFDRKYFDTFHDGHYRRDFKNPELAGMQNHLRALSKAEDSVTKTIKMLDNRKVAAKEQHMTERANAEMVATSNRALSGHLKELMPQADENTIHSTVNELIRLNQDKNAPFYIVDAEESITKKQKIAAFIESKNPAVDKDLLKTKLNTIFDLYTLSSETLAYMNKEIVPKTPAAKARKYYRPLYEVAATYRTSVDKMLDIKDNLKITAQSYDLPETASKEEVMKKMEDSGEIVKESILRGLQTKFNKIDKYAAVVEKAEVKGDKVTVKGIYDFTDVEVNALKAVEQNLNSIKDNVSGTKQVLERIMEKPLAELAKQTGFETGRFWVGKEGESGLGNPQEIRIFEQMTGKVFTSQENIDEAAKTIKNSDHSGVSATSVYHNDHGWHAMYVADVAPVEIRNPKTGKFETKDAIMHDNTWGYAERKNVWTDSNGLLRTDYACGRGGSTGYITNDLWQNGTLVDDFKNKIGRVGNESFKMIRGIILPSKESEASEKAKNLVEDILTHENRNNLRLDFLEKSILAGKLDLQELNLIKLKASGLSKINSLTKKSVNETLSKVRTKKDWDALDSNDYAKLLMERVALSQSYSSKAVESYLKTNVNSAEDLSAAKTYIIKEAAKDFIKDIKKAKMSDFDLNGYQADRMQLVKQWIDKTYDPADNAEFERILKTLQAKDSKELIVDVIRNVKPSDLGISNVTGFEALRRLRVLDDKVKDEKNDLIWADSLKQTIGMTKTGTSLPEIYYLLNRDLSNLNLDEYLKPIAGKYLKEYGVRPAFPDSAFYNEKESEANAIAVLQVINHNIKGLKTIMNEENKKEQVKAFNQNIKANIDANIDIHHRNRVMATVNKYVTEVIKDGKNQQAIAYDVVNDFKNYAITKNTGLILDEFLTLTATKENPEQAAILKSLLASALTKEAGFSLQSSVMDAISNGTAHEIGQKLMDVSLAVPKAGSKTETEKVKIGESDATLYQLLEEVAIVSGSVAAARICNSIALSDKAMKVIHKLFNFDVLKSQLSDNTKEAVLYTLKEKINFVKNLNLDATGNHMRTLFFEKCSEFLKSITKTV